MENDYVYGLQSLNLDFYKYNRVKFDIENVGLGNNYRGNKIQK